MGGRVGEVCVERVRADKGDSMCTNYICSDLSSVMTYSDIVVTAEFLFTYTYYNIRVHYLN